MTTAVFSTASSRSPLRHPGLDPGSRKRTGCQPSHPANSLRSLTRTPACHSGEAYASTLGPGIQTVRVMPWEGADTDAVCIGPALFSVWDGLFPQDLDSIHPTSQQVVRRGPRRISGAEAPASGMTWVLGVIFEVDSGAPRADARFPGMTGWDLVGDGFWIRITPPANKLSGEAPDGSSPEWRAFGAGWWCIKSVNPFFP